MACDICGTEGRLFLCEIEGTKLRVCQNCARYGKIVQAIKRPPTKKEIIKEKKIEEKRLIEKEEKTEPILIITSNFAKLIRDAREKMGLKQEEAAKKLNEKISLLHHIETGKHKPSIELARKLEKFFHVKLIEELKDQEWKGGKSSGPLTVGDLLKL